MVAVLDVAGANVTIECCHLLKLSSILVPQNDDEAATPSSSRGHIPNPFAVAASNDRQQQPQQQQPPAAPDIAARYPQQKQKQASTAVASSRQPRPPRSLLRRLVRGLVLTGVSSGLVAAGAWGGRTAYGWATGALQGIALRCMPVRGRLGSVQPHTLHIQQPMQLQIKVADGALCLSILQTPPCNERSRNAMVDDSWWLGETQLSDLVGCLYSCTCLQALASYS